MRISNPDLAGLTGRDADNWRPLFAIAEAFGGSWIKRAQDAARALTDRSRDRELDETEILADVEEVLKGIEGDPSTQELLAGLRKLPDRPWVKWRDPAQDLKKALGRFDIKRPDRLPRAGQSQRRGYKREDLTDAFKRYLKNEPDAA